MEVLLSTGPTPSSYSIYIEYSILYIVILLSELSYHLKLSQSSYNWPSPKNFPHNSWQIFVLGEESRYQGRTFSISVLITRSTNLQCWQQLLTVQKHFEFLLSSLISMFDCEKKIFFSKHRPSGPMLSISRNVRLSVRLFVRLSVCLCVQFWGTVLTSFCPHFRMWYVQYF